eukprot:TRINITY_DN6049_c0_g1_i1.p1 TRINITY_DN6049_c0_g1~~TRINITY_DN6049_c0_g1_i1.p1  ORF type:complete len:136 (+),score=44.15 TRINITY_DN6049_c0_g1_i1:260-667(+)
MLETELVFKEDLKETRKVERQLIELQSTLLAKYDKDHAEALKKMSAETLVAGLRKNLTADLKKCQEELRYVEEQIQWLEHKTGENEDEVAALLYTKRNAYGIQVLHSQDGGNSYCTWGGREGGRRERIEIERIWI